MTTNLIKLKEKHGLNCPVFSKENKFVENISQTQISFIKAFV